MLARPGLPEFDYIKAKTPQEVFAMLEENREDARLLMGGTDLFIQMRDRGEGPKILIDIKGLPGMQDVLFDKKTGLRIGAAVTLNKISSDSDVRARYPLLAESADTVGSYQLRNRATLGGNLCNASPSADLSPACLVLEADLIITGPKGERTIQLEDFWAGPGQTNLAVNEYLAAIQIPPPPKGAVGKYFKLGRSKMGDLAVVGVAVLGYPDQDAGSDKRFRIGINSTAPTAYRVPEAEAFLSQNPSNEETFTQAADVAMEVAAPIEDVRATARYQKLMVRNLTYRALKEVSDLLG